MTDDHVRIGRGKAVHSVQAALGSWASAKWTTCSSYPAMHRTSTGWVLDADVRFDPGPTTCKACLKKENRP